MNCLLLVVKWFNFFYKINPGEYNQRLEQELSSYTCFSSILQSFYSSILLSFYPSFFLFLILLVFYPSILLSFFLSILNPSILISFYHSTFYPSIIYSFLCIYSLNFLFLCDSIPFKPQSSLLDVTL